VRLLWLPKTAFYFCLGKSIKGCVVVGTSNCLSLALEFSFFKLIYFLYFQLQK
jgi:hypothetical protein